MKTLFNPLILSGCALMLISCGGDIATGSAEPQIAASVTSKQSSSMQASAADYHDLMQKIYVGYFGRPSDPGGLAFFANRLQTLGAPTTVQGLALAYGTSAEIREVVDAFGASKESADLYPGSNSQFMDAVYRNLFSREADVGGKAFWVAALDSGAITRANAALSLMSGSQGSDVTVINNKATVAAFFTASITTPLQDTAYSGLAANQVARDMLANVSAATDTTAFRSTVSATLSSLVASLPPAGLYFGQLGGGALLYQAMVLENGQYYGLYSRSATGHFTPAGLLQGTITMNNGQFSSSDIRDLNPQPYNSFTYSGPLSPQTSMAGTLTSSAGSIGIANASIPPTTFNFNQPAKNADIEGAWSMSDAEGYAVAVNVTGTAISGAGANCNLSGTVTPRATGKNVFDATITYGPTVAGACRLAGQTATGVAYTYLADEGATRQFYIALANAGRSTGNVLQGLKVLPAGIASAFTATDTVVGTGAVATAGKLVSVHYNGWLYNSTAPNQRSTKFDSSIDRGAPFEFTLGVGQVIKGWDQGVAGMRVGGKRTLVIPASLGYGATGAGTFIAPNASLVFEVEVLAVK